MKNMKLAMMALLLVAALWMVGCNDAAPSIPVGGNDAGTPDTDLDSDWEPSDTPSDTPADTPSDTPAGGNEPSYHVSPSLEKIGAIETSGTIYTIIDSAVVTAPTYGQYAITNLESGKTMDKTFADVDGVGAYFFVTEKQPTNKNDFDGINSKGVVTPDLVQTVPCEYALIQTISDDYAIACRATAITENREGAMLYMTSNMYSLEPSDGDVFYSGEWCLVELATGKIVEGFGGTEPASFSMSGTVVSMTTANGTVRRDLSGYELPADASHLSNGCYIPFDEKAVYSPSGEKLFEYSAEYAITASVSEGAFLRNRFDSTTYTAYYSLVDMTGKQISVELSKHPSVYGDAFISSQAEGTLLYDGTKIADETPSIVYRVGSYYYLRFYGRVLILDDAFNTVMDVSGENLSVDQNRLLVGLSDENYNIAYYSVPQKDFVYQGYGVAPWLVQTKDENGNAQIVNVLTDEVVLSGVRFSCMGGTQTGVAYAIVETNGLKVCYRLY